MRWLVMVLLMALCIMTAICYALLVVASEEAQRADRMYRKWKESKDEREQKISDR